jgi:hypothetical protein
MTPALFTSVGLRRSPHTPADDRRKAHGWRPLNCFELRPDFVEHGHDSRRSRAAVLDDRVGPRTYLENRTVTGMWAKFWPRSKGRRCADSFVSAASATSRAEALTVWLDASSELSVRWAPGEARRRPPRPHSGHAR